MLQTITVCVFIVLLSLPLSSSFSSDPEQQQASVTDGRVSGPAVRDLCGSGLQKASMEHPGHVDIWMNLCLIRLSQMSAIPGMNSRSWMSTCGGERQFLMNPLHMGLEKEKDIFWSHVVRVPVLKWRQRATETLLLFYCTHYREKDPSSVEGVEWTMSSQVEIFIWIHYKESPREELQHGNVPWSKSLFSRL